MEAEEVEFQLVPPRVHRQNSAERAIKTFKEYLLAVLVGLDVSSYMDLWCRLLKQTEMTLNMI